MGTRGIKTGASDSGLSILVPLTLMSLKYYTGTCPSQIMWEIIVPK